MRNMKNTSRLCGSTLTADGHACRNIIAAGQRTCKDGHMATTITSLASRSSAEKPPEGLSDESVFFAAATTPQLFVLARKGVTQAMRHLVRRENAPAKAIQHVAEHGSQAEQNAALRHRNCPAHYLDQRAGILLAGSMGPDECKLVQAIALNPKVSSRTILSLGNDPRVTPACLAALAGNPRQPMQVKTSWALSHPDSRVRENALVGLSAEVLGQALQDADSRVRAIAASLQACVTITNPAAMGLA